MALYYCSQSTLRAIVLEIMRFEVPGVRDLKLEYVRHPFQPANWRVVWLQVSDENYGRARDRADTLDALRHWIMVPDGHVLDGQVFGREKPL